MSDMETVVWKVENRMIPGYGLGQKGEEISLPRRMVEDFVKQGLVERKKKHTKHSVSDGGES